MGRNTIRFYEEKEQPQSVVLFEDDPPKTADPPKGAEPPKGEDPPKEPGKKKEEDEKLIPQKQVNELVGQARIQARETAQKKLFESLGVTSEEELMRVWTEAQKLKESQMSDAEKAQAEIDRLTKDASTAMELAKQNEALNEALKGTLTARIAALEPPKYLEEIMQDMEPAKALLFLTAHEAEIVEAKKKPGVPETGAAGKGKKKAATEEEKEAEKQRLAKKYSISY